VNKAIDRENSFEFFTIDPFIHCTEFVYSIVQCINRSIAKIERDFLRSIVYALYNTEHNFCIVNKAIDHKKSFEFFTIDSFIHCTEFVYSIVQCINRSISKIERDF
jgi:protoheme ferro-lyase